MPDPREPEPISPDDLTRLIWETRYRAPGDSDLDATRRRVARALCTPETADRGRWESRFYDLLSNFRFLPGGRILAGAGVEREVTLFNCFVMGPIPDDMAGIFEALKEGALTMQQGGGIGCDFSTLRPAGLRGRRVGRMASGPVAFLHVWDSMCATVRSGNARRGAMMGTLCCDHPDIEAFVDAKRAQGALRNFNLSVLVNDAFMQAVEQDLSWPLVFPSDALSEEDAVRFGRRIRRDWCGRRNVDCAVLREVPARALWDRIMRANFDTAGPGVLFIDRVNAENNLAYREDIRATNPCGEIPLPAYGACDLGSLNLTAFVRAPFEEHAALDLQALTTAAHTATRLLDNVIDVSHFPLPAQKAQALGSRRLGLGITGLADALIMLGLRYDSAEARTLAAEAMRTVCHAAYRASVALAAEKGPFPFFRRKAYLDGRFARRLPDDIRAGIALDGLRNSHLTAIAPTGSISLLAGNVSSGVEPVYGRHPLRMLRAADGSSRMLRVEDPACLLWRRRHGDEPPPAFRDTHAVTAEDQLAMQAALQPYVDSAISKTINVPETIRFAEFKDIYVLAHALGVKGCTVYRPNAVSGAVLTGPGGRDQTCEQC
ncbi:MAG: adenosylcobalamin-dependent ribonucleoside-diphosphate reductase [Thiohalocapsa sp.]|nr:adenosylcobalamin-dependent ribonucleoside-diphosphate reductase [Thiohalocapsa sp.]